MNHLPPTSWPPRAPPLPPPSGLPPYMYRSYGHPPPYFFPPPSLPPMDPDSAWLAQFSAHHLPSHETPPRTPPPTTMRGVRQTLLECLQRIRECKSLQEEMDRFATAYTTTRDEFHNLPARARTKLHYERRRAALTETLTRLRTQYSSFFGDDTALRQATSMAKRIHRKKLYRRNMKHHRQVHRHVLDGLTKSVHSAPTDELAAPGVRELIFFHDSLLTNVCVGIHSYETRPHMPQVNVAAATQGLPRFHQRG
ncbi:hypothetical protein, variant [Aphanomyces astaci]|uniref:Uncharacterized protein n=1 Tax=Aphanomyces astaci TaxID=112090 RepID=W4FIM5_APHAT|nr:hypothetical protein, variant [Aphanomyces astaci]ETV66681.1 hypothetical protein, variant [Aphanomyces astaci]|eukprot:XP_009843805.1 hypothetical protein, variant [Aphanomyces astaci]